MPQSDEARTIAALFAGLVFAVALVPLLLVAVLLPAIPWWIGLLLAVLGALAWTTHKINTAEEKILDRLDVADVDATEHADFLNLTENLSLTSGVKMPDLYVIEDPARNAGVISQAGDSGLVATSGLLSSVTRVELEGVVADLLVRIKSGDAETATIGAALLGMPFMDSDSLLTSVASNRLRQSLNPDRDIRADFDAVSLTRYPPGLRDALGKIRGGSRTPEVASKGLAHLWIVPTDEHATSTFDLNGRIEALAEI